MRNIHLLFFLTLLIFISSCRSVAMFESPNNLRNIPAVLYLINDKTIKGKLIVNTDNLLGNAVKMYVDGDKEAMKFNLMEIKGYEIRHDYYALKEVRGGIRIGQEYSFMRQLTPNDSRIHLYENMEKKTVRNNNTNTTTNVYEPQYYMQFPSEQGDAVWPLNSSKFVPNFDEKMSLLVADCPQLAVKIATKQPGYYYNQISLFRERRADVLMNIIQEYNHCQ